MKIKVNKFIKSGLNSKLKFINWIKLSKKCTHRPSLSLKNEISRNIVGLMEIEPLHNVLNLNVIYLKINKNLY
jgi:hypothetical protein